MSIQPVWRRANYRHWYDHNSYSSWQSQPIIASFDTIRHTENFCTLWAGCWNYLTLRVHLAEFELELRLESTTNPVH